MINYPFITDYIRSIIPERTGELGDFERECRREGYPIVKPETAKLLEFLCALKSPEKILEIGCAVGFSSILMLKSSPNVKEIITIDRYDFMIERAKKHFEAFDVKDKVKLLEGQAIEILPQLEGSFDMIFLDAAKGQYPEFLPHCMRLLAKDGLFIADNILYEGIIADEKLSSRRDRTIVKRVRAFLNEISNRDDLKTSVLPLGDGVSVSVKIN